jgi:uncharacterized protein (DUF58 family)
MSVSLKVVLVLLALSLFALAVSGQVIYARLTYLWILLIVSSFLLARGGLDQVEFKRRSRVERFEVGQVFEETFEIHNRSRLPRFWIEVKDLSDLPGSRVSRILTLIGGRRSRSFVSRTRLVSRGVFALGPTELRSGDLFGLFSSKKNIVSNKLLVVYPRLVEFGGLPNPPGLLTGGQAVRRRTHQITPNAATVREYETGDPMSRIHWPSVARRDRLIVKEFELDPLAEVWIFVDGEHRVHSKLPYELETDAGSVIFQKGRTTKLQPSTEEYATTLAASFAQHYLRAGRSVGYASAGEKLSILSAERGGKQLNRIIELTALFRATGQLPFFDFVLGQARFLGRGSTLYLITPSVENEVLYLGEQLRRLGLRAIFVLLEAISFGGKPGSLELEAKLTSLGMATWIIKQGQPLGLTKNKAQEN